MGTSKTPLFVLEPENVWEPIRKSPLTPLSLEKSIGYKTVNSKTVLDNGPSTAHPAGSCNKDLQWVKAGEFT